jgi:hypothetical protein
VTDPGSIEERAREVVARGLPRTFMPTDREKVANWIVSALMAEGLLKGEGE